MALISDSKKTKDEITWEYNAKINKLTTIRNAVCIGLIILTIPIIFYLSTSYSIKKSIILLIIWAIIAGITGSIYYVEESIKIFLGGAVIGIIISSFAGVDWTLFISAIAVCSLLIGLIFIIFQIQKNNITEEMDNRISKFEQFKKIEEEEKIRLLEERERNEDAKYDRIIKCPKCLGNGECVIVENITWPKHGGFGEVSSRHTYIYDPPCEWDAVGFFESDDETYRNSITKEVCPFCGGEKIAYAYFKGDYVHVKTLKKPIHGYYRWKDSNDYKEKLREENHKFTIKQDSKNRNLFINSRPRFQ